MFEGSSYLVLRYGLDGAVRAVTAGFAGYVIKAVKEGDWVNDGDELCRVSQAFDLVRIIARCSGMITRVRGLGAVKDGDLLVEIAIDYEPDHESHMSDE